MIIQLVDFEQVAVNGVSSFSHFLID